MKTKRLYAPAYNNKKQVIDCVANMLDIDPARCSCELQMVIGWNGEKYVTSTDWHVFYPGGECILPPCVSPQYPMFIPQRSGIFHTADAIAEIPKISHIAFASGEHAVEKFDFKQPLVITFKNDDAVILSDCEVWIDGFATWRRFTVLNGDETIYARFINGKLALM